MEVLPCTVWKPSSQNILTPQDRLRNNHSFLLEESKNNGGQQQNKATTTKTKTETKKQYPLIS